MGVAEGFFGTISDEVGYPFNHIPPQAFRSAGGGYGGQGTLCGALGVAAACIGMVCDADTQNELVNELWNWYRKHPFPQYQPAGLDLKTTVADSVICSESVGKFMQKQGVAYGDKERRERCAGVTSEIAKKTVELLNKTL
ncbi:C-GCAxxG-C-C family protein [Proteinivorax hydrogeniformans]|uniref:C-GCAxxG-C-C family protein n=1 Tax=Proteinivorax hydrogeniformans TaxID=1826727 RepID=A0AAU8HXC1_9FIRM